MLDLNNDTIECLLWRKENISKIEYLLDREIKKLKSLKKEKWEYDKKLSLEELQEFFPKVCKEVDEFLGVKGDVPKIDYFKNYSHLFLTGIGTIGFLFSYTLLSTIAGNDFISPLTDIITSSIFSGSYIFASSYFYNKTYSSKYEGVFFFKDKNIKVRKKNLIRLIPTLAHEYTHFLQNTNGLDLFNNDFFMEGQATSVEKQIALNYFKKENNKLFLEEVYKTDVSYLRQTYKILCQKFRKKPSKELLKGNLFNNKYFKKFKKYILGRSFFSIYELEHGPKIYARMFNFDYSFITENL